jgi:hypothetical protein
MEKYRYIKTYVKEIYRNFASFEEYLNHTLKLGWKLIHMEHEQYFRIQNSNPLVVYEVGDEIQQLSFLFLGTEEMEDPEDCLK